MMIRKAKHKDITNCAGLKTSNSTKISKEKEQLTQKCLHKYLDDKCTTILVAEDNSHENRCAYPAIKGGACSRFSSLRNFRSALKRGASNIQSDIIGYIVFHYDEWNNSIHIDQLYVRLDKQHQGVGSKLLNDMAERAKKQDVRIIFLETGKTDGPIKFYEKNGFRVAGHINDMYDEVPGDAIVMSRKLR